MDTERRAYIYDRIPRQGLLKPITMRDDALYAYSAPSGSGPMAAREPPFLVINSTVKYAEDIKRAIDVEAKRLMSASRLQKAAMSPAMGFGRILAG
jgi:hypothetical protein